MSSVNITSFIPKAINGTREGAMSGMISTGIKVTSQAKAFAPVDKGELRGSFMWKSDKRSGGHTSGEKITENVPSMQVVVGSAVEHAVYQEYGTRKMPPQPSLRPAVDIVTNGMSASQAMAKAISDSVKREL